MWDCRLFGAKPLSEPMLHKLLLTGHLGTNFSGIFYRNSNLFIEENTFENAVCKMEAMLSRRQCVNKQFNNGSISSSSSKVVYFNCYISGVQRFKGLKPCWAYLPPSFDHNIHIHDDLIIGKTMLVKTKTFNSSAPGRSERLH